MEGGMSKWDSNDLFEKTLGYITTTGVNPSSRAQTVPPKSCRKQSSSILSIHEEKTFIRATNEKLM